MQSNRLVVWMRMRDSGRLNPVISSLASVLITIISSTAPSAENDPVTLTVEACPDVSEAEISRILGIELLTIASGKKEVNAAPTLVTATCQSDRVVLKAAITEQEKSFYQTVPLTADKTDENERLIAIAAAELVFSAWVAVSPPAPAKSPESSTAARDSSSSSSSDGAQQSASESTAPSPAPEKRERKKRRSANGTKTRLPMKIEIGPLWRMYVEGPTHFVGGDLSLKMMPTGPLYLRAGVAVEGMIVQRPVGRVSLFAVSGAAAVGIFGRMLEYLVVGAELGGRFGLARLKGESDDDTIDKGQVKGGFGGPMLGLGIGTSSNPYAILTAELGYAFYGNIGHLETSQVMATIDLWVSAGLAMGVNF